jgi:shikimate 5-dehydrogenase
MLLENKNAVIYGAGGAIGGAVARLSRRGRNGLSRRPHVRECELPQRLRPAS